MSISKCETLETFELLLQKCMIIIRLIGLKKNPNLFIEIS